MKISTEQLKEFLSGFGEKMADHEIEEILADCVDITYEENIIIDDFAAYLMSR